MANNSRKITPWSKDPKQGGISVSPRCLQSGNLGVYTLGVYSLGPRISDLGKHSPDLLHTLGVYTLGVYTLGVYTLGVYSLSGNGFWIWPRTYSYALHSGGLHSGGL